MFETVIESEGHEHIVQSTLKEFCFCKKIFYLLVLATIIVPSNVVSTFTIGGQPQNLHAQCLTIFLLCIFLPLAIGSCT